MTLDDALAADRGGDSDLAAEIYEALLLRGLLDEEAMINLAVLYWTMTEGGASPCRTPAAVAEQRLKALLASLRLNRPSAPRAEFWTRYIDYQDLNEAFTIEACSELLGREPGYIEPAMFLFAESDGQRARPQAEALLRTCRAHPTARNRYVASILDSAFNRVEQLARRPRARR